MTSGVYAIINSDDGTAYVGSSVNIESRWAGHRYTYTSDAFEWVILEETEPTPDALESAEQRWMDYYSDRLCNIRRTARRQRPNRLYLDIHGLRLQERRERLGLSIAALSHEFGCTASSIHRWETGKEDMRYLKRIGADTVLRQLERAKRHRPAE